MSIFCGLNPMTDRLVGRAVLLRLTCRRHDKLHGNIFLELHKILLPFSNGNGLPHEGELKPGQEIASSQCNNRFSMMRTRWNSFFFGGWLWRRTVFRTFRTFSIFCLIYCILSSVSLSLHNLGLPTVKSGHQRDFDAACLTYTV